MKLCEEIISDSIMWKNFDYIINFGDKEVNDFAHFIFERKLSEYINVDCVCSIVETIDEHNNTLNYKIYTQYANNPDSDEYTVNICLNKSRYKEIKSNKELKQEISITCDNKSGEKIIDREIMYAIKEAFENEDVKLLYDKNHIKDTTTNGVDKSNDTLADCTSTFSDAIKSCINELQSILEKVENGTIIVYNKSNNKEEE